jgi:hypothetical protein
MLRRRPGGHLRAATAGHIRRTICPSAHSQRSGGKVKRRSLCSPSAAGNERPGCEVVCPAASGAKYCGSAGPSFRVTVTASSRACVSVDRSQRRGRSCACLRRGLTVYHAAYLELQGTKTGISIPSRSTYETSSAFGRRSGRVSQIRSATSRVGWSSTASLTRSNRMPKELRLRLCAGGGIGGLKRRLRARGGTPADANEREQSGEAPNHSPAMSRGDFENHFGGHQAMRRREGGDSNAAASRFVRTVAAAQSPVTLSSCSLMGVITLGAVIGAGNGFVSPKMRRALNIYAWQYSYTYCICDYLLFDSI